LNSAIKIDHAIANRLCIRLYNVSLQ